MSKSHRGKRPSVQKKLLWLPVDSRFIPDIFSFGHVTGLAKVFLEIEIICSMLVVFGTLVLLLLRICGK